MKAMRVRADLWAHPWAEAYLSTYCMSCPELGLPDGPIHKLLSEIISLLCPPCTSYPTSLPHPAALYLPL